MYTDGVLFRTGRSCKMDMLAAAADQGMHGQWISVKGAVVAQLIRACMDNGALQARN